MHCLPSTQYTLPALADSNRRRHSRLYLCSCELQRHASLPQPYAQACVSFAPLLLSLASLCHQVRVGLYVWLLRLPASITAMANNSQAAGAGSAQDDLDTGKAGKGMDVDGEVDNMSAQPPSDTDHINYFFEYGYLYHQMDMLEDTHRTGSYHEAVMSNPKSFEGKVVLDVGAGTCILSIMAARAGAKQVYAIEATDMAQRARKIVLSNGLDHIIHVIQGTVETVKLPCKVDVIISEWMGYLLLRESMLDSVLVARDKHLKPGGALFPSHATLYVAPVTDVKELQNKEAQIEVERQRWDLFESDMKGWYEADFACMKEEFVKEQRKYYLQTSCFANLVPKQLLGQAKPIMHIDLLKVTIDELKHPKEALQCSLRLTRDGVIEGFCGYFDVAFRGSPDSP
eukprot:5813607-Amphidinium_carterae.1